MKFLGLDLASHTSGYCCGDGSEPPVAGCWEFPDVTSADGADYGLLLSALYLHLQTAFRRWPDIAAVGYEAPILVGRSKNSKHASKLSTLRLLYPMGPFVEWCCRDIYRVPCHEIGVQEAKKEITGSPTGEKKDIAMIVERCGVVLPKVGRLDAGDSVAVWKRLLRAYSPNLSARWDAAIHGKKRFV